MVPLDVLLDHAPPKLLKTALRWLLLHLSERNTTLESLKAMKGNRRASANRKHDQELPYHPLILTLYQAAARGQPEIKFLAEHHVGNAREDIRCIVNEQRMEPTEAKSHYTAAAGNSADHETAAIDANGGPLAKLLKCAMVNCPLPGGHRLCTFISRIECVWLVRFSFGDDGHAVSCEVSPPFPQQGHSFHRASSCSHRHSCLRLQERPLLAHWWTRRICTSTTL